MVPERRPYRDPELAEFLMAHFVCQRLNMNSAEGKVLKEKYLKGATPFILFSDNNGQPLHWVVRELDADEIKREAERVKTMLTLSTAALT